jgi:hypothetical protein
MNKLSQYQQEKEVINDRRQTLPHLGFLSLWILGPFRLVKWKRVGCDHDFAIHVLYDSHCLLLFRTLSMSKKSSSLRFIRVVQYSKLATCERYQNLVDSVMPHCSDHDFVGEYMRLGIAVRFCGQKL